MKKEIDRVAEIFKRYNGSAVRYQPRHYSDKSIKEICDAVKPLPTGIDPVKILHDIRKKGYL